MHRSITFVVLVASSSAKQGKDVVVGRERQLAS
jgi:hypothetical protein